VRELMEIRVYYEDTDAGGIVYHANYLKFIERARSEPFFCIGQNPLDETGHFVARKIECDFMATASLGDILEIKTSLKELKSASCTLVQEIYRGKKMIFKASVNLAHLKGSKISKIPQKRLDVLANLPRV